MAGLKKYVQQHGLQGKHLVALVSGANMNFDRLRYIAERTELGEGREAILAISLPEQVGAFLTFCRALQGRGITEFNYRYNGSNSAQIFVGIALKGQIFDERQRLVQSLQEKGYGVDDLSDDETAKLHIRHLVGGHAGLADERVFRLEFPERPGALLNFLEKLGQQFNISLFHYRNHGAAEGRVLVGLQLGTHREAELQQGLAALGYPVVDITDSVGYRLFLR